MKDLHSECLKEFGPPLPIWFDTSPRRTCRKKGLSFGASFPPGRSCTATRTCSPNTLGLRLWWTFSTTPCPGRLLLWAPTNNQLSTAFFQNVNKVLTGDESAEEAVSQPQRPFSQSLPKS